MKTATIRKASIGWYVDGLLTPHTFSRLARAQQWLRDMGFKPATNYRFEKTWVKE